MAQAARHPQLKQVIEAHLNETRAQRDQLDGLLERHGADPGKHQDGSMQAIIKEAERWARQVQDPECRDAGLIASAQRVVHYEIAVYGTLATWAKQLNEEGDLTVLHAMLEEEKRTDEKLTELAKSVINPEAAQA
jgi:ferritin-like metal-binding protein YciE